MSVPPDPNLNPPLVRTAPAPILVGENVVPARNRVQWGPILAGVITALVSFLLLTILGFALGASVLDPANTAGEIGAWAGVWGAISAVVAFVVGGWIASRSAAVDGSFAGLINGLMVGATGLLLIIWLSASGLGNLFGTIGSTVSSVVNVAASVAPAAQDAANVDVEETGDAVEETTGINVDDPQAAATAVAGQIEEVTEQAEETIAAADTPETFEAVRNVSLGAFLGLLLPLLAGALGGWLGKYEREDLVRGTG